MHVSGQSALETSQTALLEAAPQSLPVADASTSVLPMAWGQFHSTWTGPAIPEGLAGIGEGSILGQVMSWALTRTTRTVTETTLALACPVSGERAGAHRSISRVNPGHSGPEGDSP